MSRERFEGTKGRAFPPSVPRLEQRPCCGSPQSRPRTHRRSRFRSPTERGHVKYPQKRPLIRLTTRPPQLETPFSVFNEPADAERRLLRPLSPHERAAASELLQPDRFRLSVGGKVTTPLTLSVAELIQKFESVETVAVLQCSGNSRGFFEPRVAGGQLNHGAMGCARWRASDSRTC